MVEGISTGPVIIQQPDKKSKSNVGKSAFGFAGLALGAKQAVEHIDACSHSVTMRGAIHDYGYVWHNSSGNSTIRDMVMKNKSSVKNFVYNYMKKQRNINLANAGLAIVGFTAAGLAVGSLIDGIVNAVKNKKSS